MTDTQSMPVEAGAEATTKGEKKPADSKNRRNRLDRILDNFDPETLTKPAEVEAPDEAKHSAAIQALKKKIDASEEKIKSIEDEISGLKGVREKQNEATKAMSAELRAFRQQVREKQVNKDSLSEQLGLLSEKKKQSAERLRTQRKQYKTTDATAIDAEIASIQKQLETSTLDLKTEKEKVHEIKKLTAQKDSIKELDAAHAALKAQEEQHEAMYRKYKAAKEEVQALRVTERDMVAKLDAAKAGAVEGDESAAAAGNANSKIEELMGEKAKLIESNKEARSEMKNLSTNLKIRFAEYREYQRAMAAYKDKLDKADLHKRREEQKQRYAKMKEERKERDKKRSEDRKQMEARMMAVANGCQLFIGGLGLRASEADLRQRFEALGNVTYAMVVRDNDTDLSKGFAFLVMETTAMAQDAIKQMNRKEVRDLCPPHGVLSVKMAEKSRQQKEWERANPSKCPHTDKKDKLDDKPEKQESKDKTDDGDKQGKEEEEEEDKGEEGKALEKREGKKKGKKWEASRDEWKAQEEAEPPEA